MTSVERVMDLIKYDSEREWLEFKENWYEAYDLGKYISAMSNSAALEGRNNAYMIWGVTDYLRSDGTREIIGTSFDPDSKSKEVKGEPLKHYLSRLLSPAINFLFENLTIDDKKIVLLTIPATKNIPVAFDNKRYIRIGSSKEDLLKWPEKEIALFDALKHGVATIENTASKYQDLTFEKLLVYYSSKGIKLSRDTFKQNLSLYTEDGNYNIMAQLLSDNSHIPIRVAIFSGKSKSDKMYSVAEIGMTCLLYSLDDALRYGSLLCIPQADECNRIVERVEVPLFSEDAFREAVINAFLHNKWINCDPPMISVFSDRIEIFSNGNLPSELSMDKFKKGFSIPVNPKLAEIFLQLKISEKTGRGVRTIIDNCGIDSFEFLDNAIVVNIRFNRINTIEDKPKDKVPASKGQTAGVAPASNNSSLNATQVRLLAEIRNNPNVTQIQLARIIGLSDVSIYNNLAKLKKLGYIERVGSKRGGYWKVLK